MKRDTHAARFFRTWAGYSYHPDRETADDGRRRTGRDLARAERRAKRMGYWFNWVEDPDGNWNPCTCEDDECSKGDSDAQGCLMIRYDNDLAPEVVQALWGITGASPQYRRVVEAELALEEMPRD